MVVTTSHMSKHFFIAAHDERLGMRDAERRCEKMAAGGKMAATCNWRKLLGGKSNLNYSSLSKSPPLNPPKGDIIHVEC